MVQSETPVPNVDDEPSTCSLILECADLCRHRIAECNQRRRSARDSAARPLCGDVSGSSYVVSGWPGTDRASAGLGI
jgi:hypothetical protein